MNATLRKVEERLRPWARGKPITLDTELYRDLGMYGDDLAFDVVLWATREFGVEGTFYLSDYAPGEQNFRPLKRLLCKLIGLKERQYNSLTVRDVVASIEARRWPEPKSSHC
jgi:hypothetical protein